MIIIIRGYYSDHEKKLQLKIKTMENSISNPYHIKGMGCGACVTTVEKIFSAISGVTSLNIDLARKQAQITSDTEIKTATFQKALGNTAYSMEEHKEANNTSETDENHKTPSNKPQNWVAPPFRSAVDSVRRRHYASVDAERGRDSFIDIRTETGYYR